MLSYIAQITETQQMLRDGVAVGVIGWFMWRNEKLMKQLISSTDRNTKATLLSTIEVSQVEKAREHAQSLLDEMNAESQGDK